MRLWIISTGALAILLAAIMSANPRAFANESGFGTVTNDPGATQPFLFSQPQNCSTQAPQLLFSDSPEKWSSITWHGHNAVILAQASTAATSAFVDFYGDNVSGQTATLAVEVATSAGYGITVPGWRVASDLSPAPVGAAASADFWNNWGTGVEQSPPPGQPAFSATVPSGDIIAGEFEVLQNARTPMTISVDAFGPGCSPSTCVPTPVPMVSPQQRGFFPASTIVIEPEIQQGDTTPRFFDVATTHTGTCGGQFVGHDETQGINLIPVVDSGDYGVIESFEVFFENDLPSIDWYVGPRGGEMTDAFFPNFFFEGTSTEICNTTYPVPNNGGVVQNSPSPAPPLAIELGSQDNRFSGGDFFGLVPGGTSTPFRYTYVPSTTGYSPQQSCVTP